MKIGNTTSMQKALALAAALALASASAWAEEAHHPEGVASAAKTPAVKAPAAKASATKATQTKAAVAPTMDMMDAKMKAMNEMHEKMMAAKTPEERSALMADHMKTMQGAMAMMGGKDGKGDMGARHQMMEKRMEMMESMMQMMMDRMPATPAMPAK